MEVRLEEAHKEGMEVKLEVVLREEGLEVIQEEAQREMSNGTHTKRDTKVKQVTNLLRDKEPTDLETTVRELVLLANVAHLVTMTE